MPKMCLTYLLSLTLLCNTVLCTFVLEEHKSLNYEVDILKSPIKVSEDESEFVVQMTSRYGQQYQCTIPYIEEKDNSNNKENSEKFEVDIKALLKPMGLASCLLRTKDWWTYEFCFGQYIKQYHIEDGKIIGNVITLGFFESDYDWSNETDNGKFHHMKQRYHSQTYANGSRCDLTGLPRTTEVRFYCDEEAGDYIYRVDEPGTCNYLLIIHTARVCKHPLLRPLPDSKIHKISCSPLLSERQYEIYLQKINGKKTTAESQRSKWLVDQQEQLKGLHSEVDDGDTDRTGYISTNNDNAETSLPNEMSMGRIGKSGDSDKEYIRDIENLKSIIPPQRYNFVKDNIHKEFDEIIREAQEELGSDIDYQLKDVAVSKLTNALNALLDKLDKKKLHGEAAVSTESSKNILGGDNYDSSIESDSKSVNRPDKVKIVSDNLRSTNSDDNKLHVRIRRMDKKSADSSEELEDMDFAQRKKLEKTIKEKLEKSGLNTNGRKIEVKIITAGYYDEEDPADFRTLSNDETSHFQQMIMALLTGQQEAIQEIERHKNLEENYKFVWDRDMEEDDAEDEEQVY